MRTKSTADRSAGAAARAAVRSTVAAATQCASGIGYLLTRGLERLGRGREDALYCDTGDCIGGGPLPRERAPGSPPRAATDGDV